MICLNCPRCHHDVPSEDLSHFVRFYAGDMGFETCPHCGYHLDWKMTIKAKRHPCAPVG